MERHAARRRILEEGIVEKRAWQGDHRETIHMFCDARGHPPHIAAVLFVDGRVVWTHKAPDKKTLEFFRTRKDNQIMGLELLSITLGITTFAEIIAGRRLIVHSDNRGSEVLFVLVLMRWSCAPSHVRCFCRCPCAGALPGRGTMLNLFMSSGSNWQSLALRCTWSGWGPTTM